ncbi:hypothetical protein [Bacillus sp. NRRL B-14911]|uniref:Uncharacterized protein n=1 Tax=Bacillus infantis NRRL B-14911 TaxID=1367477 RepID=U5LDA9_9BACI|nr:hypothetical protein [Bacillus sp. NRRL B-14911]AGX05445.1 hypothetical protein N288_17810 [Bacillus infantis NRRL B-14911]
MPHRANGFFFGQEVIDFQLIDRTEFPFCIQQLSAAMLFFSETVPALQQIWMSHKGNQLENRLQCVTLMVQCREYAIFCCGKLSYRYNKRELIITVI